MNEASVLLVAVVFGQESDENDEDVDEEDCCGAALGVTNNGEVTELLPDNLKFSSSVANRSTAGVIC